MRKKYFLLTCLFLLGCASSQEYSADSASVLVKPTLKAWIKPGATDEEESKALGECEDELKANENLRERGVLSNDWSSAAKQCMSRKGFRYYKDR